MFDYNHSDWNEPYNEKFSMKDKTGWIENSDGTYSYKIRLHSDHYVLSKKTLTKREYFKVILQGDKKGDDSE